jgi:hypothetical protein
VHRKDVVEAARSLAVDDVLYLGVAPVRIDVLRRIDGVDTEAVLARTLTTRVSDLDIPVIGLDDLITNKKAAGRKQDLADVELLELFKDGT